MRLKHWFGVSLLSVSLSACSLFGGGELKNTPAELQAISNSIGVQMGWKTSIGGNARNVGIQPVVFGTDVYTASDNGTVSRIALENGAVQWQTKLDEKLSAGPGVGSSTIAVVTDRGQIIALDNAGNVKWKAQASSDVNVPPVVGDTLVVVRSGDYRIQAFDANTGDLRWSFQRPGPALALRAPSELVISGGLVFVGMPGGKLLALAPDGTLKFEGIVTNPKGSSELERVADVVGAPMFNDKFVCAVAYQGQITCFDLQNGSPRWSRPFSSSRGLAINNIAAFAADTRDSVYSFSIGSGTNTWKQDELSFRQLSAPAAFSDILVLGDFEGVVHVLSQQDGRIVARLNTDGSPIIARPLSTPNGVVVLTTDGQLSLINLSK